MYIKQVFDMWYCVFLSYDILNIDLSKGSIYKKFII